MAITINKTYDLDRTGESVKDTLDSVEQLEKDVDELSDSVNALKSKATRILITDVKLDRSKWATENGAYYQTLEDERDENGNIINKRLSYITVDDSPHITPVLSDTTTLKSMIAAWNCIGRAKTTDGQITFYCYETKPDMDIPLQIEYFTTE